MGPTDAVLNPLAPTSDTGELPGGHPYVKTGSGSRSLVIMPGFGGCDELAAIGQPTLVFGGERDPFFTAPLARKTVAGLPNGELELVAGAKHGAFHERKWQFDSCECSFVER